MLPRNKSVLPCYCALEYYFLYSLKSLIYKCKSAFSTIVLLFSTYRPQEKSIIIELFHVEYKYLNNNNIPPYNECKKAWNPRAPSRWQDSGLYCGARVLKHPTSITMLSGARGAVRRLRKGVNNLPLNSLLNPLTNANFAVIMVIYVRVRT